MTGLISQSVDREASSFNLRYLLLPVIAGHDAAGTAFARAVAADFGADAELRRALAGEAMERDMPDVVSRKTPKGTWNDSRGQ